MLVDTAEDKRQTSQPSGSHNRRPPKKSPTPLPNPSDESPVISHVSNEEAVQTDQEVKEQKKASSKSRNKTDATPMPRQRYTIVLCLLF